ncbi:MAG: hypothetical protein AAGF12_21245 [Myxococcota bacterium]
MLWRPALPHVVWVVLVALGCGQGDAETEGTNPAGDETPVSERSSDRGESTPLQAESAAEEARVEDRRANEVVDREVVDREVVDRQVTDQEVDLEEEYPPGMDAPAPGSLEAFVYANYQEGAFEEPFYDEGEALGPRGAFEKVLMVKSGMAGAWHCQGIYIVAKIGSSWTEVSDLGDACERGTEGRSTDFRDMGFAEAAGNIYLWVHYSRGGGTGEATHDDTVTKLFEVRDGQVYEFAHLLLSRRTRRQVIDEDCYEDTLDRGEGEYNAYNFCDFEEALLSEWGTRIRFRNQRLEIRPAEGTPPGWLLGDHSMEDLRRISSEHATELQSSTTS